ncbi:MAG: hypothetical protein R6X22_09570, partial [Gemmatimonadota bacterium]
MSGNGDGRRRFAADAELAAETGAALPVEWAPPPPGPRPEAAVGPEPVTAEPETTGPEAPASRIPFVSGGDARPVPEPGPDGTWDLDRPELYLNRELTWLGFNWRILAMAEDDRTPPLERFFFLSIVSSNLDEFFMKRIGGLKQQLGAGVQELSVDGRTPEQQLRECEAEVRVL